MLFECAINSISFEGKVKAYNRLHEYHVNDTESGMLLVKVVLDKSGTKDHAIAMKK